MAVREVLLHLRSSRGPHDVRGAAERALLPGGGLQAALRAGGGPRPGQRQAEVHRDPAGQGTEGAQHAESEHHVTHGARREAPNLNRNATEGARSVSPVKRGTSKPPEVGVIGSSCHASPCSHASGQIMVAQELLGVDASQ